MTNFKRGNVLKASGVFAALVVGLAALVLGPTLTEPDTTESVVDVPSMTNAPNKLNLELAPQ